MLEVPTNENPFKLIEYATRILQAPPERSEVMIISESMAQDFVNAILASHALEDPSISFELQDDWQFLLVVVNVSALESRDQIALFLKKAQAIAEKALPWRTGDYSWMVNVIKDGVVVESIFGGDLNSPSSGHL